MHLYCSCSGRDGGGKLKIKRRYIFQLEGMNSLLGRIYCKGVLKLDKKGVALRNSKKNKNNNNLIKENYYLLYIYFVIKYTFLIVEFLQVLD